MIDLYTSPSPNGAKVHIMLEETGLEYEIHLLNLDQGDHRRPEYLALNPNGKIPAMIDRNGPGGSDITVFESGAILLYLAEKSGWFLPQGQEARWQAISWLVFQMVGLGPSLAQAGYFLNRAPEAVPRAVERFVTEGGRLFGVVDQSLANSEYLAGDYSIAIWPAFRGCEIISSSASTSRTWPTLPAGLTRSRPARPCSGG